MQRHKGDSLIPIRLPEINEGIFDTKMIEGKPFMLSFFRFATCPFCNMRMRELVSRYDEFGNDFSIVAIFDAPLEHLKRHTQGHHAPFPILADPDNKYYRLYGIEHSVCGMLKGMFFRLPTLIKGMLKGHVPLPFAIKGSMITMPADFLIDANGIIQRAYYGQDEGDHLDFEEVRLFSQS